MSRTSFRGSQPSQQLSSRPSDWEAHDWEHLRCTAACLLEGRDLVLDTFQEIAVHLQEVRSQKAAQHFPPFLLDLQI